MAQQDRAYSDTVSVGITNVLVADSLPRSVLYLRNSSAGGQVITINLAGRPAIANQGVVLKVGESFTDSDTEGYKSYQGVVNAISDGANGILSVYYR